MNDENKSDFQELEEHKSPEQKVADLKKAIEDLGYKTEETEEGEIRISE